MGACDSATAPPASFSPAAGAAEAAALNRTEAGARHWVSLQAWNSTAPAISPGGADVSGTVTVKDPSYTERGFSANANFFDIPSGYFGSPAWSPGAGSTTTVVAIR